MSVLLEEAMIVLRGVVVVQWVECSRGRVDCARADRAALVGSIELFVRYLRNGERMKTEQHLLQTARVYSHARRWLNGWYDAGVEKVLRLMRLRRACD